MNNKNSTPVSQLLNEIGCYNQNAPDSVLTFDWSYGYKGNESRNNIYYISSEKIVYFTAAVGIVYHLLKHTKEAFIFHTDDILSLALHPDRQFVATGQKKDLNLKRPQIAIWNSDNCQLFSVIPGNSDNSGFCALAFSPDGSKLVSANLTSKHSISIWHWTEGTLIAESIAGDRILDVSFSNLNNTFVSCGVRNIKFWSLKGNTLTAKPGQFGKNFLLQSIFSIGVSPDGCYTYAGTSNGDIYIFQDFKCIRSLQNSHTSIVLSICSTLQGFLTSSKDGTVKMWEHITFSCLKTFDLKSSSFGYQDIQIRSIYWDIGIDSIIGGTRGSEIFQIHLKDNTPILLEKGHAEGELWALAIHPFDSFFATGSDDCSLIVWNWIEKKMVQCRQFPSKIRSVCYSYDAKQMVCGTLDGCIFVILAEDIMTDLSIIHKRKECIQVVKFSPNNLFLAVGSSDNFVDVYSVQNDFKLIGVCKGASSFITHLDWSSDSSILQSNSGARERLFFQVTTSGIDRIAPKSEEVRNILWFTGNTLLGEEVLGIWQKYQVLNDINNIDTNFRNMLIVTGDDDCKINLYNYPVFKKGAKSNRFMGHSSHVTNVKFSHDLSTLFSIGGSDHTILQWKVHYSEDPMLSVQNSDAEFTGTDTSDFEAVDSDLENEKSKQVVPRKIRVYKQHKSVKDPKSPETYAKGEQSIGKSDFPPQTLELTYVHGYRGYDCRDNLFYSSKGEIIYHIAALGIVYDKSEKKQRFYTKHTDDILCLDVHPSRLIVATGQIGAVPSIHIWDTETMGTLSIIQGTHTRGICAMDFSADGFMLASIGLDDNHTITIHNWKSGNLLASVGGHKDRIFMIRWNPFNPSQLVTVGVKHIKFWTRVGKSMESKRGILPKDKKNTTILAITFSHAEPQDSEKFLFTGGSDGNVYIWKEEQCNRIQPAHEGAIYSLLSMPDACLSGGKDGKVIFWNNDMSSIIRELFIDQSSFMAGNPMKNFPCIRSIDFQGNTLVGTKENEIIEITRSTMVVLVRGHSQGELWGLAHDPITSTFATISDDATLRIWNLEIQEMMYLKELPCGGRVVVYSNNGKYIVVGLQNGKILFYDSESMESKGELHNRSTEITSLKFSPDDRYLAVASKDREVDIYSTTKECRVGVGKGSSATIVHLDWDISSKIIRINSMAREILYFEAPRAKRIFISKENMPEWKTLTCSMGEDTKGVWYEGADITDVNSLDCNLKQNILATGDDLGFVRLYNYPSCVTKAKHKSYVGHSAHVTCVRFSSNGSFLVSLGGNDTSIFVWKLGESSLNHNQDNVEIISTTGDEGGYDSYVDWELKIDYLEKIYANPIRYPIDCNEDPTNHALNFPLIKKGLTSSTKVLTKEGTSDFNSLKLDYVFGYRGFDCRSNLKFLGENHILYNAAAVGIILDIVNNTQWFYDQHNDDILSLAVFLSENILLESIVATGQIGKDGAIHVWTVFNKDPLSILSGAHDKGVCSLSFSNSGRLLASVGIEDSHNIAVWDWKVGTLISSVDASHYRIFQVLCITTPKSKQTVQNNNQFLVTCGISHLKYWAVTGSKLISERLSLGLDSSCETILSVLEHDDDRLIFGSLSGFVYIFINLLITQSIKLHNGPIWALCCHPDGILSGSRGLTDTDMVLKLTTLQGNTIHEIASKMDVSDIRAIDYKNNVLIIGTSNSIIFQIKGGVKTCLNQGHGYGELWGLATHPLKMIAITGSHDSCIKTWDLSTKRTICTLEKLPSPVQSLDINQDADTVAVGFCNGQITLFEIKSNGELEKESVKRKKRDYSSAINLVKFSPDGKHLAVVCSKNFVDIYNLPHVVKHATCRGFKGVVSNLDWSDDSSYIQINTLQLQRLIYRISDANPVFDTEFIGQIIWSTLTCVSGPDLVGILPANAQLGDVNISHLSNRGHILATGDDYGLVKLFNFPVDQKDAAFLQFHGHSAHVTNLHFTHNDNYLVSTGGDDSCLFLWKTFKDTV